MTTQIKGNDTSTFGGEIKTNNDSIISNRPIVSAKMSANQTINDVTDTKIAFDTATIDTDSAFDTSTYRFTVPSGKAGKYHINACVKLDDGGTNVFYTVLYLYKNGTSIRRNYSNFAANPITGFPTCIDAILDLSVGDYLEIYAKINTVDNTTGTAVGNTDAWFEIHKLIG